MSGRAASWLAWSLVMLSVALLLGGIALSRASGSAVSDLPLGGEAADGSVVADLIVLLTFSVVGAIIASRQPWNAIGWLFCSVGVVIGLNSFAGDYAEFWLATGIGTRSLGETAAWSASWLWVLLVYVPTSFLLLFFPDGRPASPRWRPVAWAAALGTAGGVAGIALESGPLGDFPQIVNPYGLDSPLVVMVGVAGNIGAAVAMVASAVSIIVRLRRATGVERQQLKWLAYGGTVMVGAIGVGGLIILWSVPASIVVMSLALLGLPLFTGIAIVKHRLYDIDLLINRTLVYGSLTSMLVASYIAVVVFLQYVFRVLSGGESQLAIVASTLAIAAAFNPLRSRVQAFVDRRFYRRKYDAAKTLSAFSARLRDETDLDTLSEELVGVVMETMQPGHVSLWLRHDSASKGLRNHA